MTILSWEPLLGDVEYELDGGGRLHPLTGYADTLNDARRDALATISRLHVRPTLPGQQSRRRTTATSVSGWPDLVLIHPDRGLADIYQQTDPHHQEVAS